MDKEKILSVEIPNVVSNAMKNSSTHHAVEILVDYLGYAKSVSELGIDRIALLVSNIKSVETELLIPVVMEVLDQKGVSQGIPQGWITHSLSGVDDENFFVWKMNRIKEKEKENKVQIGQLQQLIRNRDEVMRYAGEGFKLKMAEAEDRNQQLSYENHTLQHQITELEARATTSFEKGYRKGIHRIDKITSELQEELGVVKNIATEGNKQAAQHLREIENLKDKLKKIHDMINAKPWKDIRAQSAKILIDIDNLITIDRNKRKGKVRKCR
jgi:hypothetical protein